MKIKFQEWSWKRKNFCVHSAQPATPQNPHLKIMWTQSTKTLDLTCASTAAKVKLTTCFHEFSKYKSTNFFYQILDLVWFSQIIKTEEKMPFLTNKEFVFFFNWEILVKKFVDSYSKKFVKTCRELYTRFWDTALFATSYQAGSFVPNLRLQKMWREICQKIWS